jgi:hypothetical protein
MAPLILEYVRCRIPCEVRQRSGQQRREHRVPRHARQPDGSKDAEARRDQLDQRLLQQQVEREVGEQPGRQAEPGERGEAMRVVPREVRHEVPEIGRDAADRERGRHLQPPHDPRKRQDSGRMSERIRH